MTRGLIIGAISSIVISVFSGCGSAINLSEFKAVPISKSPNAPSKKALERETLPKIIITDLDNNAIRLAKQSSLGSSISTALNSELSNSRIVQVVRRVDGVSLSKEIEAKELAIQTGIDVGETDYIISGSISNATYNYSFAEAYTIEIAGKKIPVPSKMKYEACVSGNIQIFSLPDMREEKSIPFSECSSTSTEAKNANNPRRRNDGLVRQAGEEGADSASYEIKNFFSKKGYIYEMRRDDDQNIILKTTLGKNSGVEDGLEVEIFTIRDVVNPLTEKSSKEEIKIGDGIVSDQIENSSSWIKVENLDDGEKIMIGDFIKIKHEESLLNMAIKVYQ